MGGGFGCFVWTVLTFTHAVGGLVQITGVLFLDGGLRMRTWEMVMKDKESGGGGGVWVVRCGWGKC